MNESRGPLNDFQKECENALREELRRRGRTLEDREIVPSVEGDEDTEPCLQARISNSSFTIWISSDQAIFQDDGEGRYFRCEALDHDSPDDLCLNFVGRVAAYLDGRKREASAWLILPLGKQIRAIARSFCKRDWYQFRFDLIYLLFEGVSFGILIILALAVLAVPVGIVAAIVWLT